jgi:predicted anti-sigma-YlaC factor YlaD
MKKDCEIVNDLLPLYIDDVCSKSSRGLVEEHLKNCKNCKKSFKH